jgi:hypothetical protein
MRRSKQGLSIIGVFVFVAVGCAPIDAEKGQIDASAGGPVDTRFWRSPCSAERSVFLQWRDLIRRRKEGVDATNSVSMTFELLVLKDSAVDLGRLRAYSINVPKYGTLLADGMVMDETFVDDDGRCSMRRLDSGATFAVLVDGASRTYFVQDFLPEGAIKQNRMRAVIPKLHESIIGCRVLSDDGARVKRMRLGAVFEANNIHCYATVETDSHGCADLAGPPNCDIHVCSLESEADDLSSLPKGSAVASDWILGGVSLRTTTTRRVVDWIARRAR